MRPAWGAGAGAAAGMALRTYREDLTDRASRALALGLDLSPSTWLVVRGGQCHEATVAIVEEDLLHDFGYSMDRLSTSEAPRLLTLARTDAFVSSLQGVCLTVYTADCVPVVAVDSEAGVIGIAHAGWRGTVAAIARRLVETMISRGAQSGRLRVWIAPGIGLQNFEVGPEVIEKWREAFPDFAEEVIGDRHIDLQKTIRLQMLGTGIDRSSIEDSAGFCTFADSAGFFSYRRDGTCGAHLISGIVLSSRG